MTLKAIIHDAEEGGFWAEVPALPGCFTQGETIKELETNLLEAIEGWLLAAEPEGAVPDGRVLEVAVRRQFLAKNWPSAPRQKGGHCRALPEVTTSTRWPEESSG